MCERELDIEYFEWLCNIVCKDRFADSISYRTLLKSLNQIEFRWTISKDENRARDGIALRHRFGLTLGYSDLEDYISGPCSVLEMMIALAIRCEEDIMDDPDIGDRTAQWFWRMITNLGLGAMTDDRFDDYLVDNVIDDLLDRQYKPDGRGGLFTVRDCNRDLRKVEIWIQMLWYLDTIT